MTKKIAIILPTLGGGGAERLHIELANQFVSAGYAVDLILFKEEGALIPMTGEQIEIINLNAKQIRNGFFPLIRLFKKNKPNVILAAMWPVTVIAVWAKLISRISATVVLSEHTTFSLSPVYRRKWNRLALPWSMKMSYPFAGAVIGVSRGVVDDLRMLTNSSRTNFVTIYNPAAPDPVAVSQAKPNFNFWKKTGSKKIIAVGALKDAKDYPTMLLAFERLTQCTDAELLILGEGENRKQIEEQRYSLGLEEKVHLPGFVANPIPFLKSADLFVLSSAWEGFGNVLVEALACGIPVVSTDCKSGPAEILQHGRFGTLVPVGDHERLFEAIKESLGQKYDADTLKARASNFTSKKIGSQYLKLLFPDE